MTTTTPDASPAASTATTFDSLNPATGDVIASYPVHTDDEVREAVERAHVAAAWWGGLTFDERAKRLRAWKGVIARRLPELAQVVHVENGKPFDDAVLEIVLAIDHIEWAAKNAKRVLGRRSVSSGMLMMNQKATLEYQPFGVVGVIGPWNYPVFTPMGSLAYALSGGNAVVFKPSEYTPGVGAWLVDAFNEAVTDGPAGAPVLQLLTGLGATGAALCRANVGKIAFTGSAATGRRVMAACAENLTPVLMECGGKDALIVDADADVEAAADAALWGGMSNAGQTCIGTERVYVVDAVYDRFVERLTSLAADVTAGSGDKASYGPMTMPAQLAIVKRHIDDALAKGGRAVVGGADSVTDRYVEPVILLDVPEDSTAITEETFGPTIVVNRVRDADEAVERANATGYGLAAAVFARKRGVELAHKMRSGMASVNGVLSFAGIPGLPFGGVGESGFGRIHGDDGLREFTRAKAVASQRFPLPVNLLSFTRDERIMPIVVKAMGLLHGRS